MPDLKIADTSRFHNAKYPTFWHKGQIPGLKIARTHAARIIYHSPCEIVKLQVSTTSLSLFLVVVVVAVVGVVVYETNLPARLEYDHEPHVGVSGTSRRLTNSHRLSHRGPQPPHDNKVGVPSCASKTLQPQVSIHHQSP